MKIDQKEMIILKLDMQQKQDKTSYVAISMACVEDGTTINIISNNLDYIKLQPFSKCLADFTLNETRYGLKLSLENLEAIE